MEAVGTSCPVAAGYEAVRDKAYPVSGDLLARDPHYRENLGSVRVDSKYPKFVSSMDSPGVCKWISRMGYTDAHGCGNDAYWEVRVPDLSNPAWESTEYRCGLHRDCWYDPFDPEEGCQAH